MAPLSVLEAHAGRGVVARWYPPRGSARPQAVASGYSPDIAVLASQASSSYRLFAHGLKDGCG
jgi:hypothetical protein